MQLAQLNIGKFRGPRDDPRMADFYDNLDRVNAVAERMPGFVWRLKDDSGNATGIAWAGDPAFAVNMSVWDSVEALERFVFMTVHRGIYARKHEFFDVPAEPTFVMWFVPDGHIPTLQALSRPWRRRLCLWLERCAGRQTLAGKTLRLTSAPAGCLRSACPGAAAGRGPCARPVRSYAWRSAPPALRPG